MIDPNQSRTLAVRPRAGCFLAVFLLAGLLAIRLTQAAGLAATNSPSAISWNQIGAKAGADYKGDGLAVTRNGEGALWHAGAFAQRQRAGVHRLCDPRLAQRQAGEDDLHYPRFALGERLH